MASIGEESLYTERRALTWRGREDLAASLTGTREHDVDLQPQASLDYAVMTEGSAFPAGWVRFNQNLKGYVFSMLIPGGQEPAPPHGDPRQAVPDWVGAHTLRAIHPISEDLTGDMQAAAPAMLALLKQVRMLLVEDDLHLDGVDLDDLDHVVAIAEGRA